MRKEFQKLEIKKEGNKIVLDYEIKFHNLNY